MYESLKYHLLLWVCLTSLPLTAQTFQGQVTDQTNGKALETVIVCLLRADSTHLEFGYTDAEGRFTVQAPENKEPPVYLSFHLLGYAQRTVPIAQGQTSFRIALVPKEFKLKKVKITPERITRRGDTLTYKVSGFKMPQDKQIADVLKRLPGIEVASDGAISYEGKRINAFYIDGMDLLGGRYTIASNNLEAKKVKEIQVLTNHQKIKALKGINFSDQAALNLVLEENSKSRFMAAADIEGGYGDGERSKLLWNNRLIGMRFGRTRQNLTMYKNTNTGEQIEWEFLDKIEQSRLAGDKEKGILATGGKNTDLPEQRTAFNNAHALTTNQLWKPNKETDWRLQLHYLHDEPEQLSNTAITYFLPEGERLVTETEQSHQKTDKLSAELNYTRNAPNLYLKNELKGNLTFTDNQQTMNTNQSPLTQNTYLKEQHLHHTFEWVHRKNQNAFTLYSENRYDRFPQQMEVSDGLYEMPPSPGQPYEGWRQQVDLQSFRTHTYTHFQHRLWRMMIRYQAGVEGQIQWLNTALHLRQDGNWNIGHPDFTNRIRFSDGSLYAEPSLFLIQSVWQFELLCRLSYKSLQLKTSLPESLDEQEHHFITEPQLRLLWTPNGLWKLQLNSSYGSRFGNIHELYGGYIFTSYRSASLYGKQIRKQRSGKLRGTVSYENPMLGWFSSWNGSYSFILRNLLYERALQSILEERKALYHPNRSTQWSLNSQNTKTFAFWKSSITLTALYSSVTSEQKLQGEMTTVRSDMANVQFNAGIQPIRQLSFDWKSGYQYQRLRAVLPSASTYQWSHKLQCHVFPSEKWQITWGNEFYHNNHPENHDSFFSDVMIEYSGPNFDISLNTRNLFNRDTYQRIYVSDMSESVYWYNLRPREITLRISFAL